MFLYSHHDIFFSFKKKKKVNFICIKLDKIEKETLNENK